MQRDLKDGLLEARDAGTFPPDFSLEIYRDLHADLAALDDEQLRDHYQEFGRSEGRQCCYIRDRTDFLELFSDRRPALEIGAFDTCLLAQNDVSHFDVLDQENLRSRARELNRNAAGVPHIDYVSPNGDLGVIPDNFELVLSSHAIEHTPDLIQHLIDVSKLLTSTGVYALMIPNCLYCFDHFIPPSSIAEVLQAHAEQRKVHNLASVVEHRALTTHNDPARHWDGDHGDPVGVVPSRVLRAMDEWKAAKGGYIDVHAWQFTPQSFRDLIGGLNACDLTPLRVARVYESVRGTNEFLAILERA